MVYQIMMGEIKKVLVILVFGLGAWFIYSSAKEVIMAQGFSSMQMLSIGLLIIGVLLFFIKFTPIKLLFR